MIYYVTFRIDARFIAGIEADSMDEARKKAEETFSDADFGEARDIDGEAIIVEDEKGNFVWEK